MVAGTLVPAPVQASTAALEVPNSGIWLRCRTVPLTWSLYIAPRAKLVAAKERRLIARALAKVTAASDGVYTFTYVPTTGTPRVAWDLTKMMQIQMLNPSYVSTPRVDLLFMVTGRGQPTIEQSDGSWPFLPGQPYHSSRGKGAYTSESATDAIAFTTRAQGYFEAKDMARSAVRERSGAYLWAAASAVGSDRVQISGSLSPAARQEIAGLARMSCGAVAAYPDATARDDIPGSILVS
jgi:hypothetical protein